MIDLKSYINDEESNKDKILEEILNLVYKKILNNNEPYGHFIDNLVKIYLKNTDLKINELTFEGDMYLDGGFYYDTRTLYFNLNNIEDKVKYLVNDKFYNYNLKNTLLLRYFNTMMIVFHELTHIRQYDIKDSNPIYNYCFDYIKLEPRRYDFFHDRVPIERLADTKGIVYSYEILKNLASKQDLRSMEIIGLTRFLSNFKASNTKEFTYPLEWFNTITKNTLLPNFDILIPEVELLDSNLYDRFRIGYIVTEEEYSKQEKRLIKLKGE